MTQVETRDYDLAILIILVLFCWPAAIVYYFTRPIVVRYQAPPAFDQQNQANPPRYGYCPQCGQPIYADSTRYCPKCGKQLA